MQYNRDMDNHYVIDGSFLTWKIFGMQRYAWELTKRLDEMPGIPEKLTVLVPAYFEKEVGLKHIPVVRYGMHRGRKWRQLDLARYLREHKAKGLFFENVVPMTYRHGIVVLHDIIFRVRPDFFMVRPKSILVISFWWTVYRLIALSGLTVVTVSEFSKAEIMKYYKIRPERIHVIGNGWEHLENIREEELPEDTASALSGKPYLLTLASSSTRHKNAGWIFRAAKTHPSMTFVLAGGVNHELISGAPENILFPGYISDGQLKLLLKHCAAFIFPSYYEGFGIPPLEAAASGAPRLFLSDIPVLHEVYGDCAAYFDPDGSGEELPALLQTPEKDFSPLLARYTWEDSAKKLRELLK